MSHSSEVRNPTGMCFCGCGEKTPTAKTTKCGYRLGEHIMFVPGHNRRTKATQAPNPSGLCMCGCGLPVPIHAGPSVAARGLVRGQHVKFVAGHAGRKSPHDYEVDPQSGCWNWKRAVSSSGYGIATHNGRLTTAHRFYYETFVGPIPIGLHIDHLCRNRLCVNPAHLEAVTQSENNRRAALSKKESVSKCQ